MLSQLRWITGAVLLIGLALSVGCSDRVVVVPSSDPAEARPVGASGPGATASAESGTDEHGHAAGAHGGIVVPLGGDLFHVEAVVEKGGTLRLYTLGKDETRVIDIETQTLKAFAKVAGAAEAEQFQLEAAPQDGDGPGRTSQFAGLLPASVQGHPMEVTIPNIMIASERFRLSFTNSPNPQATALPDKVTDAAEREIYLTPGGKYTAEDIKANGGVTATIKFQGLKSAHDMKPKPGDKICPITKTKANPQFSWIVDGKSYQFCCPPCVDEFVKAAKETPDEIKPPDEYILR